VLSSVLFSGVFDDAYNINEICDNPVYDKIPNGKITELEITVAIRKLKNNKAPGTDNILMST
jgi:hypothetical protein